MNNETRNIILSICYLKKYIFENIELSEDNKKNLKRQFDYIEARLNILLIDEIEEANRIIKKANDNVHLLNERGSQIYKKGGLK